MFGHLPVPGVCSQASPHRALLLGISAAISGIVMFIYSVLLIILNRRALPEATKIRIVRLVDMAWAVPVFGGF